VVSPTAGDITSTSSFTVTTTSQTTTTTTTTTTTATAAPTISGFSPSSGSSGTVVQVGGKNFTGATSVKFNGTPADFTVTSDGQITTRVPTGATSGTLTVTTSGGTVTSSGSFTVAAGAPTISGFYPSSSGAVGSSVGIQGHGFTGAT